jgi:hypothetical protein
MSGLLTPTFGGGGSAPDLVGVSDAVFRVGIVFVVVARVSKPGMAASSELGLFT